jgi:2-polyprenyl-3-methyl-5-hydroxy-6-metoxy-1,4-benzoquinol methylase
MTIATDSVGQVGGHLSPFLEKQRLEHAMPYMIDARSILDIGCGRAKVLEYVKQVETYVGVDLLETVLEGNRARYPQHQFLRINVEQDDLPQNWQFDTILMLAILEHLVDPEATLARILRALAPSGRLILTTPHPFSNGIHRLGARVGLFSQEAANEHHTFFNRKSLAALASMSGAQTHVYRRFQLGLNQIAVFTL